MDKCKISPATNKLGSKSIIKIHQNRGQASQANAVMTFLLTFLAFSISFNASATAQAQAQDRVLVPSEKCPLVHRIIDKCEAGDRKACIWVSILVRTKCLKPKQSSKKKNTE